MRQVAMDQDWHLTLVIECLQAKMRILEKNHAGEIRERDQELVKLREAYCDLWRS